jgi:hypothetical protein
VATAIRKVIDGAPGVIRIGCEKFRTNELSPKERAEITYRRLVAEQNHFLAYKGLEWEYWMRGMLIDGRCTEMKFSSWIKSHWDKDRYMLMECQFSKRGDKLTVGEWKKVLEEMMLMFRDDHYHTREGGLTEDFEKTIEVLSDRLCTKMGLGKDTTRVEEEEVTLIDLTPRNSLDAVLVAEAIMGGRSPITI